MSIQSKKQNKIIRVVVVDDSPTARELLVAILSEARDIQVVGTGANGEDAVRLVKRLKPDLITLDADMPVMDGLEATRRIMRDQPIPILIISASYKFKDADITFQALKAGALQVINKPGLNDPETSNKVIEAVRLMAGVPVIHHWGRLQTIQNLPELSMSETGNGTGPLKPDITNRDIIGIASSTGGPAALAAILRSLTDGFPLPILVVQHVSPGFAPGLAEWLSGQTRLRVEIASHGMSLLPGVVILAPDDYHIQVNEKGVVELIKAAPFKGLRPSANYLFQSLARFFGPRSVGIILTGMGDDGAEGMEALHLSGGITFAQNEESCVVFGMPHEAIIRNAIDYVMNLEQIAFTLARLNPSPLSPKKKGEMG